VLVVMCLLLAFAGLTFVGLYVQKSRRQQPDIAAAFSPPPSAAPVPIVSAVAPVAIAPPTPTPEPVASVVPSAVPAVVAKKPAHNSRPATAPTGSAKYYDERF